LALGSWGVLKYTLHLHDVPFSGFEEIELFSRIEVTMGPTYGIPNAGKLHVFRKSQSSGEHVFFFSGSPGRPTFFESCEFCDKMLFFFGH
jgi:hypothetical protein